MAEARVPTTCDQCGQTDTHPKAMTLDYTKHHDCLSYSEKQNLAASHPRVAATIEAAEAGTHGDDLLAHILSLQEKENEG